MREQNSPYSEILDGANLSGVELGDEVSFEDVALRESNLSNANLRDADLSGADLRDADLSDANLRDADLSGANLRSADLSGANLRSADLPRVNLMHADLSDALLRNADLSDAFLGGAGLFGVNLGNAILSGAFLRAAYLSDALLRNADLSGADLRDADLSGADLREADVEEVSVNGKTTCNRLHEGYTADHSTLGSYTPLRLRRLVKSSKFGSQQWDATARSYHDLKTTFADHGLVGKARTKHVQERRARSLEAKAAGGRFNRRYLKSLLSRVFTGYGVGVRNLVFWMTTLFVISTAVYVHGDVQDTFLTTISYSVLAFTVAPPRAPSGTVTQLVMMIETFFGTLSIVLLGYILGNRERF